MKRNLKRALLHLFFPNRCPVCKCVIGAQERFCDGCFKKLTLYTDNYCPRNAASFTACFVYDENIKPAIFLLKRGICGNADYALGMELADRLRNKKFDVIVPVPVSKERLKQRHYNQSELIGRIVGEELKIPVCSSALKLSRSIAQQKMLTKAMRKKNVSGAYIAEKPQLIKDKSILLIDDICTTGSTIEEIIKVLLSAGAKEVHTACPCKTAPLSLRKKNG